MPVNKKARELYFKIFDGTETMAANAIMNFQERRTLKKYVKHMPRLTSEQKKAVKEFWKPYCRVSADWARYYTYGNGKFDPRYIPNDLQYTKIDQHFNNRKMGYGLCDKNYYSLIFSGIRQPEILVRNIDGILEDENYCLLTKEEVLKKIAENDDVICKPSVESGAGRYIQFWNTKAQSKEIKSFIYDKNEKDYVIQRIIKQHAELDKVHKDSVNTLRIVSLLMRDGVYVLSSNLRMGVGDSRIDNVMAGGISCGINEDGTLKKYATAYYSGERYERHPQGLVFDGFRVPSYDKTIDLVKQLHPLIPHFRLVSWDFAVNASGEPVLIEVNLRKGGINLNQFNNGPLFGDLTKKVLDEVFGK